MDSYDDGDSIEENVAGQTAAPRQQESLLTPNGENIASNNDFNADSRASKDRSEDKEPESDQFSDPVV